MFIVYGGGGFSMFRAISLLHMINNRFIGQYHFTETNKLCVPKQVKWLRHCGYQACETIYMHLTKPLFSRSDEMNINAISRIMMS